MTRHHHIFLGSLFALTSFVLTPLLTGCLMDPTGTCHPEHPVVVRDLAAVDLSAGPVTVPLSISLPIWSSGPRDGYDRWVVAVRLSAPSCGGSGTAEARIERLDGTSTSFTRTIPVHCGTEEWASIGSYADLEESDFSCDAAGCRGDFRVVVEPTELTATELEVALVRSTAGTCDGSTDVRSDATIESWGR